MKKNRMMRLASVLLICVLLTTSVVGGTFAKYVTTQTGTDTARVARWGVSFSATTFLFAQSYKDSAVTDDSATVKLSTTDKANLVAPGTEGTGFSIMNSAISEPEVSYNVTIKLDSTDAKVPTLKYTPDSGSENVYEPVKFSVYNGNTKIKDNMTLSDLTKAFDGTKAIYQYNVGAGNYYIDNNLDGTIEQTAVSAKPEIKIHWEWVYKDNVNQELYDKLDTVLGNTAAGTKNITRYDGGSVSDINTEVKLSWTMTATQID